MAAESKSLTEQVQDLEEKVQLYAEVNKLLSDFVDQQGLNDIFKAFVQKRGIH